MYKKQTNKKLQKIKIDFLFYHDLFDVNRVIITYYPLRKKTLYLKCNNFLFLIVKTYFISIENLMLNKHLNI